MKRRKITLDELPFGGYHVKINGIGIAVMGVSYTFNYILGTSKRNAGFTVESDKLLKYPFHQNREEKIALTIPAKWVETKQEGEKYIQDRLNKFVDTLLFNPFLN